jgi:HK97 gp10 family phage protein
MCVSVEMQVDVYGIPELRFKLDSLDQSMRALVDQALEFEVQAMQTRAQNLAPKRTGYLASTVFAERVKEWAFKLGARAPYALFVEFGTRRMQPRRFLRRALELGMPGLVQHVNQAIQNAIREASG